MAKGQKKVKKEKVRLVAQLCPKEVVELANQVRSEFHPDLAEAMIAFVFVPKGPVRAGKVSLGNTGKESQVHALLSKVDFIIRFSKDQWEGLSDGQRRALADHELCHCATKEDRFGKRVGWRIVRHDVEEFRAVVERHGVWVKDLEALVKAGIAYWPRRRR